MATKKRGGGGGARADGARRGAKCADRCREAPSRAGRRSRVTRRAWRRRARAGCVAACPCFAARARTTDSISNVFVSPANIVCPLCILRTLELQGICKFQSLQPATDVSSKILLETVMTDAGV